MTLPSQESRALVDAGKRDLLDWQYEFGCEGGSAIFLHGLMAALACEYVGATYWDILAMAKERVSPSAKQ